LVVVVVSFSLADKVPSATKTERVTSTERLLFLFSHSNAQMFLVSGSCLMAARFSFSFSSPFPFLLLCHRSYATKK
jgi:hypothetical protein